MDILRLRLVVKVNKQKETQIFESLFSYIFYIKQLKKQYAKTKEETKLVLEYAFWNKW